MTLTSRVSEFLPRGVSRLAFPLILGAVILLALFSPSANSTSAFDPRLSSRLAGPNGAQGIYEVAQRLGWKTERRNTAPFDSIESGTIIAVLAPSIALSERETSVLLKRVRDGASLLTVVERGTPLADSLHLDVSRGAITIPIEPPATLQCSTREPQGVFRFPGANAPMRPFSRMLSRSSDYEIFAASKGQNPQDRAYAAVGLTLGKGRVAAISDPNFLRNDFLRVCRWGLGIAATRMLEYLSAEKNPHDTRLVFDELHHGFGPQPSVNRAAGRLLFGTSWGSLILQLIVASLVLLLAVAPRPIAPAPAPRVQRRSQFEHVEALSSAYQQISATRLVTATLLRGVRRRLGRETSAVARQSESDEQFLHRVALSHPHISGDVARVSAALTGSASPSKLVDTVAAIETIERTIKR